MEGPGECHGGLGAPVRRRHRLERGEDTIAALAEVDADGALLVATDASWRSGLLPVTKSGIYYGEDFDARITAQDSAGVEALAFDTGIASGVGSASVAVGNERVPLAFVGAVISETLASNDGIGYMMLQAASQFRTSLMFAGLIVIAAMGIGAYLVCALVEARMTGWATRKQAVMTGGG